MSGRAKTYFNKFNFRVIIPGFGSAGFSKVGPLDGGSEVIEHYEGGGILPDKSPGLAKYEDVVLEAGATENDDMYRWFESVQDAGAGIGSRDPNHYKRNIIVEELYRDGTVAKTWDVYGAFPNKFEAGDWDNSASEKTIRKVTLTIDYFKRGAV